MAVFEYKGFDKVGKAVSGIIDADNPKVARGRLRKQGLYPTEIHLQKKGGGATRGQGLNVEIDLARMFQRVSSRDVSVLTRQLATLLGASVPMAETLNALVEQSEKQKLKVVLSEVKEQVNEGSTLADALSKHPHIFNELFVQMVRAGERSGALSAVLLRLASFNEAQVKLRGKVQGAMLYPILMAIIGVGILTGLFYFIVPQMRDLLQSVNGQDTTLPIPTMIVFFIGDALTSGLACVFGVVAVLGFFGFRYWVRNGGKRWWHGVLLKVPLLGKLNRMIAVSRFCRTLSTLLVSGVPIISALAIVKDVVGNMVIQEAVESASKNIQEGQSIAAPLRKSGQFPPMVIHMIAIGERTGELEAMLVNVADAYESEVDATIEGLTSLLGPLMIVAMGGAVFLVALGLLLPLANLTSQF